MNQLQILMPRLQKELTDLSREPPPKISCWPPGDDLTALEAIIEGAEATPFDKGKFKLEISIPHRYPFEPPRIRFITKIYHPNIDEAGRICLDILKPKPMGTWEPIMNLRSALLSLQLLMADPNPEDPLVADISEQFVSNRAGYTSTAQAWTRKYAMGDSGEKTLNLSLVPIAPTLLGQPAAPAQSKAIPPVESKSEPPAAVPKRESDTKARKAGAQPEAKPEPKQEAAQPEPKKRPKLDEESDTKARKDKAERKEKDQSLRKESSQGTIKKRPRPDEDASSQSKKETYQLKRKTPVALTEDEEEEAPAPKRRKLSEEVVEKVNPATAPAPAAATKPRNLAKPRTSLFVKR